MWLKYQLLTTWLFRVSIWWTQSLKDILFLCRNLLSNLLLQLSCPKFKQRWSLHDASAGAKVSVLINHLERWFILNVLLILGFLSKLYFLVLPLICIEFLETFFFYNWFWRDSWLLSLVLLKWNRTITMILKLSLTLNYVHGSSKDQHFRKILMQSCRFNNFSLILNQIVLFDSLMLLQQMTGMVEQLIWNVFCFFLRN